MTDQDTTTPPPDKKLTGRQKSGKAGGEATKEKHGPDFFREIGKKGGESKGKGGDAPQGPSPV
jgi:general stress protein YciG